MKRLIVCVAAIAAVVMAGLTPAHGAGVSAAVIAGTGTISPGLTTVSGPQTVSFTGTGVGGGAVTGSVVGTAGPLVNCSFSGSGSGSVASGSGTASGDCNGSGPLGTGNVHCDALAYAQTGAIVVVGPSTCTATASGPGGSGAAAGTVGGVFVFVPTSANPVTSYALAGAAVGVSAP